MADEQSKPSGPDLTAGVEANDFKDNMLLGHVGDQEVLLVRSGGEIFAIDAHCSHYHGPLAEGLVVGEGIRCPWHHACFDLRTGEAVRAPALSALSVWRVEQTAGRIVVREKQKQPGPSRKPTADAPKRIVIVGGGAAGFAAAEMLETGAIRRRNHHAEQRRGAAGRSSQSVEGLSRRQCAGGLAAAAADWFLCGFRHRSPPCSRRRVHRCEVAAGRARRRKDAAL